MSDVTFGLFQAIDFDIREAKNRLLNRRPHLTGLSNGLNKRYLAERLDTAKSSKDIRIIESVPRSINSLVVEVVIFQGQAGLELICETVFEFSLGIQSAVGPLSLSGSVGKEFVGLGVPGGERFGAEYPTEELFVGACGAGEKTGKEREDRGCGAK